MRNITFFAIFCVALVTVIAAPNSLSDSNNHGIRRQEATLDQVRMAMTLKIMTLEEYTPLDWLSDVINAILGVGVGELLTTINTTLTKLSALITQGVTQLQDVMKNGDQKVKEEIQSIINDALSDALDNVKPIVDDLGLVLPQITFRALANQRDAADIISAILGVSLEEFLLNVADAMEKSDVLLTTTMGKLKILADNVAATNPGVAADLHFISDEVLSLGKSVIRPVLDSLYQVLPTSPKINSQAQLMEEVKDRKGIFAEIISTVLGIDVVEAGIQLEITLKELEIMLHSYVAQVNAILINSPERRDEANLIINQSIRAIRHTLRPIENVLMPFVRESLKGQDINRDIVGSILGVSLENFLFYIDFTSNRIEEIVNATITDMETLAGTANRYAMKKLNEKSILEAEEAVEPLLEMIEQILPGDRKWVTPDEFLNHIEMLGYDKPNAKIFCDFSLIKGHNAEFIINIISSILGFDLVTAVQELDVALDGLDRLLVATTLQLQEIIGTKGYGCQENVTGIIIKAVNESQITIQPILDVLVQFLPDESRHHKDVMNSIIEAISGIGFEEFVNYLKFASGQFDKVVTSAVLDVKLAVSNEGKETIYQVDTLLDKTIKAAAKIIEPFQEIIAPILEEHDRSS